MGRRHRRGTALVVCAGLLLPLGIQGVCSAAETRFVAPAAGEIIRRFEPPIAFYAPGHRGIDFGVPKGSEVVASGAGVVSFAGPVAGDGLFVTIDHGEALETTYSFLSEIDVEAGDHLARGKPIGKSGEGHPGEGIESLHFGAKFAGEYIDPEFLLFGNLEDVSNLIALAPLDEASFASDAPRTSGEGSDLLGDAKPFSAAMPGGIKGIFLGIGSLISKGFGWLGSVPAKLGSMFRSGATAVGGFFKGVGRLAGRGVDAAGAAWDRVARGAASLWTKVKAGAATAGKAIAGAAGSAGRWLGKAVRLLGRWGGGLLRTVWGAVRRAAPWFGRGAGRFFGWLGDLAANAWRKAARLGPVKSLVKVFKVFNLLLLAAHVTKGAFQQWKCRGEGSAPPRLGGPGRKPPPPPTDHIVVALAGIGSETSFDKGRKVSTNASMYAMDWGSMGISEGQVYNFSYAGMAEGGPGAYRLHKPYRKSDTEQPIELAALKLEEQIDEIHRRNPGKEIDIVAHSQGGLVAQYYIEEFYLPDKGGDPPKLASFVTIATPHHGADLASFHRRVARGEGGKAVMEGWDVISGRFGMTRASSPAARQMAEGSDFITDLNRKWDPSKVKTTTVAATFDVVVTPQHTRLAGAKHYTADMPAAAGSFWAHGSVVNASSTREIVYNSLRGSPSRCSALRNAVADHGVGDFVSDMEDGLLFLYGAVANLAPA